MCDICRASPCLSACPNAAPPVPVCAVCGGAVEQVPLFGAVLCARCEEEGGIGDAAVIFGGGAAK